ncbi:RsmB/NOP family class I SAM-dependent RNA methyltransferase [Sphingomonas sp. NBWT7]|uniref:RsmB/NOP family class I SAM-dependent RNA methyltransferase n=1 Tax=Sphingomonas sp. NBWT7 TaxID=2596913 RepID=UPI001624886B|nr:RsmB/NOP family class I SAM-dependent RNA methyltransferase [Sphingomonas sp. NBWT7]QNE32855.1 RsmB/NOP family class I SAM-dependent RNA methyltransferase [Sphingomonas sp. NBWT7]
MPAPANPRPPRPAAPNRRPADPPGTAARRAAMRLLDAVLRRGDPLEAALPAATRDLAEANDRGLAHAIAAEALRRLPDLDAVIDSATRQRLPDDAKARTALRIALVQALALGTPPHAAIATVLPLVDGGPRKLVHGVFGSLTRGGATLPDVPTLPPAVAERWRAAWGEAAVAAAAAAIAAPPPLDLTLADPDALAPDGLALAPDQRRLVDAGPVARLPGYAEGKWWVQDVAASLPARLLGRGAGEVIDLCAAPGGKTMQLAAAGWNVTALEVSPARAARLHENLARTGLPAKVVIADALHWAPPVPVDALLIDAPCSATGIFRRHPDVLYRAHAAIVADMAALQAQLLARAAEWVRPGGRLVYATCSLERAEGEDQLTRFLADHPDYRVDPPATGELPAGFAAHDRGYLRTLPGTLAAEGGCDGFFVVRLVRASA